MRRRSPETIGPLPTLSSFFDRTTYGKIVFLHRSVQKLHLASKFIVGAELDEFVSQRKLAQLRFKVWHASQREQTQMTHGRSAEHECHAPGQ